MIAGILVQMKNKAIFIIGLLIILGGVFIFSNDDVKDSEISPELVTSFQEELGRAGIERVGQPIEGFTAFMYLDAFSAFEAADFDRVRSYEGIYNFEAGELKYERTTDQPVTSAEDVISSDGYDVLLINFSKRVGIEVRSEEDIATILEKLREKDENKTSYISDDFSIWTPEGWYPYENNNSVLFSHDESLEIPKNTDGFAISPWFQVSILSHDTESGEAIGLEEYFAQNLWTEGSEFLISKESILINGLKGTKVVTVAAGADGEVLHYVFNPDDRIFTLSLYPFERGSDDTDDFERAVATFMPNYIGIR